MEETSGNVINGTATEATAEIAQGESRYTQSDLDKAIAKAIETREKNLKAQWEKEQEDKTKKARLETEKAKLEAEKKFEELYKMQIEQVESQKKELEAERIQLRVNAKLSEHKVPAVFADYILPISETPDQAEDNVKTFKKLLDTYVDEKIKEIQGAGISVKGVKSPTNSTSESLGKRLARLEPKEPDSTIYFKEP